jgi:hypothetical protein
MMITNMIIIGILIVAILAILCGDPIEFIQTCVERYKAHKEIVHKEVVDINESLEMPKPYNSGKISDLEKKVSDIVHQRIFPGYSFITVRPNWLINPNTNRALELDLYNHCLRIGIEVQGDQHRRFVAKYHKNNDDYLKQVDRDKIKRRLCKEVGVILIEVWSEDVSEEKIRNKLKLASAARDGTFFRPVCGGLTECQKWKDNITIVN